MQISPLLPDGLTFDDNDEEQFLKVPADIDQHVPITSVETHLLDKMDKMTKEPRPLVILLGRQETKPLTNKYKGSLTVRTMSEENPKSVLLY